MMPLKAKKRQGSSATPGAKAEAGDSLSSQHVETRTSGCGKSRTNFRCVKAPRFAFLCLQMHQETNTGPEGRVSSEKLSMLQMETKERLVG